MAVWLAGPATGGAQAPDRPGGGRPSFEVASVKPSSQPDARRASRIEASRYVATNVTARDIIMAAYDLVVDEQVRDGPPWLTSERFDVAALVGAESSRERI